MKTLNEPIYSQALMDERVWGGNRLGKMFGKPIPPGRIIGESWELSDRPGMQTLVSGGHWEGQPLRALMEQAGQALLGPALCALKPARFPLLVKFIDSGEPLSVQVHPDDNAARRFNDRGKTECWVVIHVEPGARIIRGLRPGTTRETYQEAVARNRVADVLNEFSPRVGEVIALPPGMVHAMGAGVVVAEIQQNSDLTFRIYDYNRPGLDGKPRQLHLAEALEAIRFTHPGDEFTCDLTTNTVAAPTGREQSGVASELLLDGRFFNLERHTLAPLSRLALPSLPEAPRVLMALAGSGMLGGRSLPAGQTVLLPASMPRVELCAGPAESLTVLVSMPKAAAC